MSQGSPGRTLTWCGVRGARLEALVPILRRQLHIHPVPHTVVIHLGTNNLFSTPVKKIRQRMEEGLLATRNMLPNTTIIWSDILPRLFYFGAQKRVGKKTTRSLNRFAEKICKQLGNAHRIIHAQSITDSLHSLYRHDGVHLSCLGNDLFRGNLSSAIGFLTVNPPSLQYPPLQS